ncbi:hypothetical protein HY29_18155 [Hyphomonas beringensis]|uniref:3-oxoacyl-ACP reductase n=1 Tax=Hyphomonas beringensis TaxID=1280946 RepID=A0A062TW49_9PROT|nr:SDR family oxidoreductase [Hyphomonas beringensis]KCZ52256.1 hypothetical protein HY29_18155 [Hyphomonas beringensis]
MTQLDKKIAIVTGAGSGMGAATAVLFAQNGATVALLDRNKDGLEATLKKITEAGGTAQCWPIDLALTDNIPAVIESVAAEFGGIDIVVNNAGIAGFLAIDDPDYDAHWDRMISINLTAQQKIVRAALPWLRKSESPRIVNIASTEALGATPLDSAYVASKAGVAGLTRALAVDLGPEGILVNCICPGPIDTSMTSFVPADHKVIFAKRRTALKRYGGPEEVAQMTLAMSLPTQTYLTGTVVPVDGGLMARNA